jgi:hypothetical protein
MDLSHDRLSNEGINIGICPYTVRENKTRQAMYVYRNTEARTRSHPCCGKALGSLLRICLCVCVGLPGRVGVCMRARVALLIQHATRMRHIVSFVTSLPSQAFSTLSHKRHDFRKKITEDKICVLIFSTAFV